MVTWVLVIFMTIGAMGRSGGMIGTIDGFRDQDECRRAGETVRVAFEGSLKEVRFVCVVQTTPPTKGK